ncbi:MAG: thermonuclease family protein [SAR202 cluster bacterium]|nr:thermonuclease family protein [SAR202 cluster bacterium]
MEVASRALSSKNMKNPFRGTKWYTWVIIFITASLLFSRSIPMFAPIFSGGGDSHPSETATVVRVIDGDTIEVDLNGSRYRVRYIGMNTPETNHPSRGLEFYGAEASERNRQLVEGKTVRMERDVSATDQYDRLLRYVYVDDVMVNATLITEGYAVASAYDPDTKFASRFEKFQKEAMEDRRGAWATSPALAEACDPSYPTICVPQDADPMTCDDIPSTPFPTLRPDPHGFDPDGDGLGCDG